MNKTKAKDIKQLALMAGLLVVLNVLAYFYFFRIDLTQDKRYSLGEPTKVLLNNLEQPMYIEVFMKGDFPARFEKIEKAIEDKLKEMRLKSKSKLIYRFTDPYSIKDDSLKRQTFERLMAMGIDPMNITEFASDQASEKVIFPGAVITYNNRQVGVNLVKGNASLDINDDARIAQSISLIEYELANGIKMVAKGRRNKVGFLRGHGESTGKQLVAIARELSKFSQVSMLDLSAINSIDSLQTFDLIVSVKPMRAYQEDDKYKLDQFLMNGGNLAFYLDIIDLRPDSVSKDKIIGVPRELNLTDMLFTYGVRVNQSIIQDMQGSQIPVEVSKGNYSTQANYFSPVITQFSKHQSVKYGKPVLLQDCSTIDTITADGITKTPLMFSSQYTKVNGGQIFFPIAEFMKPKDQNYFNRSNLPVCYLLEGKFRSNFEFKPVPTGFDRNTKLLRAKKEAKIIVCSDGDIISNQVNPQTGEPMPLGMNPYNRKEVFANTEVVSSLFDYQLGDAEINALRIKEIEKRPLDEIKVRDSKLFWQILNLGLPLLLIGMLGGIGYFIRKWRFTRFR
jgi:ABC-2 type transport system permease protein